MVLLIIFALTTLEYFGGEGAGEEVLIGGLPGEKLSQNQDDGLDLAETEPSAEDPLELDNLFEEVVPRDTSRDAGGIDVQLGGVPPSGSEGGGYGIGGIRGGGGGLGTGVKFMGRSARGKRFCIIADCSGSMRGAKLEFVKQEILETINGMTRDKQFQVVFFSSRAIPFPRTVWLRPRKDKAEVVNWLATITGGGSTQPVPAFKAAFGLRPRPDVIFFMTDGIFDPSAAPAIAALNGRDGKKTIIHTISFVNRSAEHLLRQIATASGGKYSHVAGF